MTTVNAAAKPRVSRRSVARMAVAVIVASLISEGVRAQAPHATEGVRRVGVLDNMRCSLFGLGCEIQIGISEQIMERMQISLAGRRVNIAMYDDLALPRNSGYAEDVHALLAEYLGRMGAFIVSDRTQSEFEFVIAPGVALESRRAIERDFGRATSRVTLGISNAPVRADTRWMFHVEYVGYGAEAYARTITPFVIHRFFREFDRLVDPMQRNAVPLVMFYAIARDRVNETEQLIDPGRLR